MDERKKQRLAEMGGRITTVEEFLGITEDDMKTRVYREKYPYYQAWTMDGGTWYVMRCDRGRVENGHHYEKREVIVEGLNQGAARHIAARLSPALTVDEAKQAAKEILAA